MSYLDPLRIDYKGDKEVALRHVRDARRCVWAFLQALKGSGATSGRQTFNIQDGVQIEVVVAMKQVTATIIAPGGGKKARWFEDFVPFSGIAAFEGDKIVYYPLIIQPDQNENDPGYRTYFRSASAPGFDAAPQPKGTYIDVFPRTDLKGLEGSMYLPSGGINHRNTKGEYVSWVGYSKYFVPPYRTPWTTGSTFVYHQGHTLLNTVERNQIEKDTSNEVFVLGAGMHDGYLYTVQAALNFNIPYSVPAAPTTRRSAWMSPVWPNVDAATSLRRYRLYPVMDELTGVWHYRIVQGSMEVLQRLPIGRGYNYWVFNEDCSRAVSYQLPEEVRWRFEEAELRTTPSTASNKLVFSIDTNAGSASFSFAGAGQQIAEDNGKIMALVGGGSAWDYVSDWWSIPAIRINGTSSVTTTELVFADLQYGWALVYEKAVNYTPLTETTAGEQHNYRLMIYKPDGTSETLNSLSTAMAGGVQRWALEGRIQAINTVLSQSTGGMRLLYNQMAGVIVDEFVPGADPAEDPPALDRVAVLTITPLQLLGFSTNSVGTSVGGVLVTTAGDEYQDRWGEWNVSAGFGPGGTVNPFSDIVNPEVFVVTGGGAGTEKRALAGARMSSTSPSGTPVFITANYLTDSDLEDISGGTFNTSDRYAISVAILGVPPIAQTIDY